MQFLVNVLTVVAVAHGFAYSVNASVTNRFETDDALAVTANVQHLKKTLKTSDQNILKVAKYLTYIKLVPSKPNYKTELSRLLNSSLQFILCDDLLDTACLEATPVIKPKLKNRMDAVPLLGQATPAGDQLEIEYFFTHGWYTNFVNKTKPFIPPSHTVAGDLAEKIRAEGTTAVTLALYGIDDIGKSMAPVFNAVQEKMNTHGNVRAVIDVSDSPRPNSFLRDYDLRRVEYGKYIPENISGQMDYSYFKPHDLRLWAFGPPVWLGEFLADLENYAQENNLNKSGLRNHLSAAGILANQNFIGNFKSAKDDAIWLALNVGSPDVSTSTRMSFQYTHSIDFIQMLNKDITSNAQARAHVEYPFSGIMHNKFVVLENDQKRKSVWTGTANISETCMGTEENANVSIFIKNDIIAQTFLEEFNEMYSGKVTKVRPPTLQTGAYHTDKVANTKRYFTFNDHTEVRVHFSPSDDAEHRVILPMIYSAKPGDILRISMFGSAGYEFVRAFQSAAARGVKIQIAIDSLTGAGAGSWAKNPVANLFQPNPFSASPKGSIEIRKNSWKGLNHHKSATLTRRLKNGTYHPEIMIVGSQNWSANGNDVNDENIVTITNTRKALPIVRAFNDEFDQKIWTSSEVVTPKVLNEIMTGIDAGLAFEAQ